MRFLCFLLGIAVLLASFACFGGMFEFVDANMRLRPMFMIPILATMAVGIAMLLGIGCALVGLSLGMIKDEDVPDTPKPPAQE